MVIRKFTTSYQWSCSNFKNLFLLLVLQGAMGYSLQAQHMPAGKEINILPVPAIGYSPETRTYLGAVTLFTFRNRNDSLTRTSNANIEFNYTWNKQIILEADWNWFAPQEKWFSRGLVHYSKYPDLYYGIGFDTPETNEIQFDSDRFLAGLDLFRNIKRKRFIGGGFKINSYRNIDFFSKDKSYSSSELHNVGIHVMYLVDSRNHILSPSDGTYFEFNNALNFGTSSYFKTMVDYRKYATRGENNSHIFAFRFYHESVWGNPPFYAFPMLGGDEYLRGYYLGRFRDRNLSIIQGEYRKRLWRRIGMAAFGGTAMIYDKINNFSLAGFKPNAGIGLRFLVDADEQTNFRIDYAIGTRDQSGFYISFGESF